MDKFVTEFKKRILQKKIKIAVVGLGYVGLPLAIEFAKKGFDVTGIDIDKDRVERIRKKESYITDISDDELKKVILKKKFKAENSFHVLKDVDAILICVPTPLKRKYIPNISYIKNAIRAISVNIKKPALIILESTTYPGTTEEVIMPMLENKDLKHGKDFYLSFSPERIDPGNKSFPVHKIPKVVGGINKEATELTRLLYSQILDKVVPVSSSKVAETVKLLENTFRIVNIGLIDEITMMCHKMNIDVQEVISAAKTKPFGFMPFYPGPGVGGHCIPKDPLYLYWRAKHHGFRCRFIKLASDTINYMPQYVIERTEDILHKKGLDLNKSKILIIGVTYKKDIKDLRKSPALDIIEILQRKNIPVAYHDPLIPYLKLNSFNLKSVKLDGKILCGFDCVIIATDHTSINYTHILRHAKIIFDTRNIYSGRRDNKIFRL